MERTEISQVRCRKCGDMHEANTAYDRYVCCDCAGTGRRIVVACLYCGSWCVELVSDVLPCPVCALDLRDEARTFSDSVSSKLAENQDWCNLDSESLMSRMDLAVFKLKEAVDIKLGRTMAMDHAAVISMCAMLIAKESDYVEV